MTYLKNLGSSFLDSIGWIDLIFYCLFLCFLGPDESSTILAYAAFRACELLDLIFGPLFRLEEQCLCKEET